jgi:hypothetical protein
MMSLTSGSSSIIKIFDMKTFLRKYDIFSYHLICACASMPGFNFFHFFLVRFNI